MKKFTVVLRHPEYASQDSLDKDYSVLHEHGETPEEAVVQARRSARLVLRDPAGKLWSEVCGEWFNEMDFVPVFVCAGHVQNIPVHE